MKNNYHFCSLMFGIYCLLALFGARAESPVAGLKSEKYGDREKAAQTIQKSYDELVTELIELAKQKVKPLSESTPERLKYPWRDSKHLAMLLLGDLHVEKAIPVLLENLEYENPRSVVWNSDIGNNYPAVGSLAKIGMPAISPVIKKIGEYGEKTQGYLNCLWILEKVLGSDLGKTRLEVAINEENDGKAKKDLKKALENFKKYYPYSTDESGKWKQ